MPMARSAQCEGQQISVRTGVGEGLLAACFWPDLAADVTADAEAPVVIEPAGRIAIPGAVPGVAGLRSAGAVPSVPVPSVPCRCRGPRCRCRFRRCRASVVPVPSVVPASVRIRRADPEPVPESCPVTGIDAGVRNHGALVPRSIAQIDAADRRKYPCRCRGRGRRRLRLPAPPSSRDPMSAEVDVDGGGCIAVGRCWCRCRWCCRG